jgi:hypothetical protein
MALRRRGSDHKVSQLVDIFSRAAFRSATRHSSAAKSKQVPMMTKRCHKNSSAQTGKGEVERRLTSQHLAGRLDNAKNEIFAFFIMNNPSHQTGDLLLKGRYFLHIATCLASLFNSHLCLTFGQRKASLKVRYPGRIRCALTASTRSRRNLRIESTDRGRSRNVSQRFIGARRLQAKKGKERRKTFQRGSIKIYTKRIYLHKSTTLWLRFSGCT